MTDTRPVVVAATQVLAHTPGLARLGSKPTRTLAGKPELRAQFLASLRSFPAAVAYAPHQAYLGALPPRALPPRPWTGAEEAEGGADRFGPAGENMPEEEFF